LVARILKKWIMGKKKSSGRYIGFSLGRWGGMGQGEFEFGDR
jgi:hypothetical protein